VKVTYNWLKDFVEIKIAPQLLADKLTMAGLEVTSLEKKGQDFVFEVEVTSNRPDCLSVVGIAREVAAITNSAFSVERLADRKKKNLKLSAIRYPLSAKTLRIEIEDKKDCPLYTAKIIKGVKVEPSPSWLRDRLELIGCRSVNNIVDITNYILFELGEPLHAFDLDKLSQGGIFIRRAKDGEKMVTIDGEQRMLNKDLLVIADREKPVALAGVMGGKDTEVVEDTKNILLEAAVFNPIVVRHGRRGLGLQSESAYRFERGIDSEIVEVASQRAAKLIQELAGGECVLAKSSRVPQKKRKSIKLEVSAADKILGVNIAPTKIKRILDNLGLKPKMKTKNKFSVEVPGHRLDINLEIDLIEEIARIFGYENIPKSLPAVKSQISVSETQDNVSLIKNILAGLGLNEVITYSLIDKEIAKSFAQIEEYPLIEILNPLSKEQEVLRPSLAPGLARCVAYNLNQKQDYINVFEIAKAFLGSHNSPKEEWVLGIALSGIKSLLLEQGRIEDAVGPLHLKGILEVLFERLGIKNYNFNNSPDPLVFNININQEKVGVLGKLKRDVLDKFDIKNRDVFMAELYLEKVFAAAQLKKKFTPPPRYPGINRDISFILKDDISIKEVLESIKAQGGQLLRNINIIDYYKGEQIPSGYRGLTISCFYCSDERTLTETEINPTHNLIYGLLTERFGAKMR
jgi:phenylalanyl-tRNA synthetase beta chain